MHSLLPPEQSLKSQKLLVQLLWTTASCTLSRDTTTEPLCLLQVIFVLGRVRLGTVDDDPRVIETDLYDSKGYPSPGQERV